MGDDDGSSRGGIQTSVEVGFYGRRHLRAQPERKALLASLERHRNRAAAFRGSERRHAITA